MISSVLRLVPGSEHCFIKVPRATMAVINEVIIAIFPQTDFGASDIELSCSDHCFILGFARK